MHYVPVAPPPPPTTAIFRNFKKSTAPCKVHNMGLRYIKFWIFPLCKDIGKLFTKPLYVRTSKLLVNLFILFTTAASNFQIFIVHKYDETQIYFLCKNKHRTVLNWISWVVTDLEQKASETEG